MAATVFATTTAVSALAVPPPPGCNPPCDIGGWPRADIKVAKTFDRVYTDELFVNLDESNVWFSAFSPSDPDRSTDGSVVLYHGLSPVVWAAWLEQG
jgi:hypothetical protein